VQHLELSCAQYLMTAILAHFISLFAPDTAGGTRTGWLWFATVGSVHIKEEFRGRK